MHRAVQPYTLKQLVLCLNALLCCMYSQDVLAEVFRRIVQYRRWAPSATAAARSHPHEQQPRQRPQAYQLSWTCKSCCQHGCQQHRPCECSKSPAHDSLPSTADNGSSTTQWAPSGKWRRAVANVSRRSGILLGPPAKLTGQTVCLTLLTCRCHSWRNCKQGFLAAGYQPR